MTNRGVMQRSPYGKNRKRKFFLIDFMYDDDKETNNILITFFMIKRRGKSWLVKVL
jgi:hypothetical protein